MAATGTPTPNIGLRIPLGTDPASVDDINYNSNLIDTKLGAVGNDSVQDQIDDLNSKITSLQARYARYDYDVPANSSVYTNLYTIINNSKPSSSTVLGIVGFSTNDQSVFLVSIKYENSNYSVQIRNVSNTAISNHIDIYYLTIG